MNCLKKIAVIFLLSAFIWPGIYPALAGSWSDFHRAVYALHKQETAKYKLRIEEEEGEYLGASGKGYRYLDTRYYDQASGRLISRVRRDEAKPELIHIVEVNLYENEKLVRDFGSITLPWAPLSSVNTMINLHQYNGELHSFRQHNLDGEVEYEFCEGKLNGAPVRISLDKTDINQANTSTVEYKACFNGMRKDWAQYKMPH